MSDKLYFNSISITKLESYFNPKREVRYTVTCISQFHLTFNTILLFRTFIEQECEIDSSCIFHNDSHQFRINVNNYNAGIQLANKIRKEFAF